MIPPHVRFWHLADIRAALSNVRFRGDSEHRGFRASCLLLTHTGSRTAQFAVMHNIALYR